MPDLPSKQPFGDPATLPPATSIAGTVGKPITERALAHWVTRLTPGLVRLSFGICRDRQRAEDIVQEAFVRLWKHPPIGGEPAISSWMRSTVTNLSISLIRRKKRTWTLIDESGTAHDVRATAPEVDVERREDVSRISAALERIDPEKRAMIMLRVNEGLSYEAIAEHLGVPIGTVMSRLNRARLALLGELEGDEATKTEDADGVSTSARPSEFNPQRAREAKRRAE